ITYKIQEQSFTQDYSLSDDGVLDFIMALILDLQRNVSKQFMILGDGLFFSFLSIDDFSIVEEINKSIENLRPTPKVILI
ncbi:MAG: hypothetical protein GY827_06050, partial [Cytophagales bacterium]|nr:hypothetical protein [Cytophagales bacterium]